MVQSDFRTHPSLGLFPRRASSALDLTLAASSGVPDCEVGVPKMRLRQRRWASPDEELADEAGRDTITGSVCC